MYFKSQLDWKSNGDELWSPFDFQSSCDFSQNNYLEF